MTTARHHQYRFLDGPDWKDPLRPAVAFWRHEPLADQDAAALAAAVVRWAEDSETEIVKVTPASSWQLVDRGVGDAWDGDPIGRRTFVSGVVSAAEDWARLRPLATDRGMVAIQIEAVARVREAMGPNACILATVFTPLFQAMKLALPAGVGPWIAEAPQALAVAMERLTEDTRVVVASLMAAGADGIFIADHHAGDPSIPTWWQQEVALPAESRCLGELGDRFLVRHYHGGAPSRERIPAGNAVLHFDRTPEWAIDDDSIALIHGLEPTMINDAADEALDLAWRGLLAGRPRNAVALGASCCVLPDTPPDRLRRLRRIAREMR